MEASSRSCPKVVLAAIPSRQAPFDRELLNDLLSLDHPYNTELTLSHTTSTMADRFPSLEDFDSGGELSYSFLYQNLTVRFQMRKEPLVLIRQPLLVKTF